MTLSKDEILAKRSALPQTVVSVPGMGDVIVRSLTLRQVGEIIAMNKRDDPGHQINARVMIMACINEDGEPLFVGSDRAAIEELPSGLTTAVVNAVMKLSGLSDDADPKAPSGSGETDSDSPPSSDGQ